MHTLPNPDNTSTTTPVSALPEYNNSYAKMSSRGRAIACTTCAKAKTKCDKLIPSCTRCTTKGLQCEPRSTRRTSDNSYRNSRKHMVSPKRYTSTNSVPTLSRHGSPRSVPSERHQLVRSVSHMDHHNAAKLGQHRSEFTTMPMLTPLQTYQPHIVDEFYSPPQNTTKYAPVIDKPMLPISGRLTPQTPETFLYNESVSIMEPTDHYMSQQSWSDDGHVSSRHGFGAEVSGLMSSEPNMQMWSASGSDNNSTAMGTMHPYDSPMCVSPASMHAWPSTCMSTSPPQLPHTRGVSSLSISECSLQDYGSPNGIQEEWQAMMQKSNTSAPYYESVKAVSMDPQIWNDDNMLSTYH